MKNDNTQQQTAIVTGASSGIGLRLTQALLTQGYRVVANSRTISDHEFLKKLHPIRRLAEIPELVDSVLYLTSATFVTGEVLHIDGGAHAGK
jgi:NAD(P)-dependent dehydrogenase (short-subunit alcohol dehydrogenase family)